MVRQCRAAARASRDTVYRVALRGLIGSWLTSGRRPLTSRDSGIRESAPSANEIASSTSRRVTVVQPEDLGWTREIPEKGQTFEDVVRNVKTNL